MKLFAPCLLILSLVPAAAGASSGTLHFRGALVEPTCQSEALDAAAPPAGRLSVRVYDCRVLPSETENATAGGEHQLHGPAQPLTLTGVVAELAGRTQLEMLTLRYE